MFLPFFLTIFHFVKCILQVAHKNLMENGSRELHILTTLTQEKGVWKNPILCGILSQEQLDPDKGKILND